MAVYTKCEQCGDESVFLDGEQVLVCLRGVVFETHCKSCGTKQRCSPDVKQRPKAPMVMPATPEKAVRAALGLVGADGRPLR